MAKRFGWVSFVAGLIALGVVFVLLQAWAPPSFVLEQLGAPGGRSPPPESPRALLHVREARVATDWAKQAVVDAAGDPAAQAGAVTASDDAKDPALVAADRVALERFVTPYVASHPLPSDAELAYGKASNNPPRWRTYVLARGAIVGDTDITAARVLPKTEDSGSSSIEIQINADAKKRLAEHTTAHRGKPLAVVVDGNVMFATTIVEPITGGKMRVAVGTYDEARRMAGRLGGAPNEPPFYILQAARLAVALVAGLIVLGAVFLIIRR
jgi:preprotein translocase subunit SecD